MAIEPSFSQFLTLPCAFSLLEPEAFGFGFEINLRKMLNLATVSYIYRKVS